ncbi:ATP synthase F0 subcomplex B subunit [Geosporobacter subterraneus DSM 17957]|uniref:ATP synthase subunit b n=1 Tax=Geosporobacter subterraneus DSM 17957 TaxID=1121919 RepID=A0A1M6CGE2_9FIRM|nr:F0F1 ATP synthase subunit B [Geosporobacter subterraneus]SHI60056.1 ATP synthase F0 subcomplex B subunit [Geosporobacter subterraneus DSM 17957]
MMKAGLVEINWNLAFQIINTIILYIILKKLLFKPVTEFMAARQNSIVESMQEADDKNAQADKLMQEYQLKLAGAQDEGREIIKEASKRAEDRANEIVKSAQEEASKIKERAEAEIKREQQKAVNALKNEVAAMAVAAAGKIINKNLDVKEHSQLINEFIDEVGEAKWHN